MKSIYLNGNNQFPSIVLDKEFEKFEISGNSNHNDINFYFKPVFEWIEEYIKQPLKKTTFNFKLNYYNSVSSSIIFKIMQQLQNLKDIGNDVCVNWYYQSDDESMIEVGMDFKEIFVFDIDLIEYN